MSAASGRPPARLGILVSGRGSNMAALADAAASGALPAVVALVVSNVPDVPALDEARRRGLACEVVPHLGLAREAHAGRVLQALRATRVDLVCLAGYMRLLPPSFIDAFRGRILNVHPSLLPAFPGLDAQRQALEHGVKVTGCTVHVVDEQLDHGPIVLQAAVPVLDGDDEAALSARILRVEHPTYVEAVRRFASGEVRIEGCRIVPA